MKLIGVAAALASNAWVAHAGLAQIESSLIELLKGERNLTRGAAFTAFFRNQIDQIIDSGCWCVFDDDHYGSFWETMVAFVDFLISTTF